MYLIDRELQGKKNEKKAKKSPFSHQVELAIQKSNNFKEDLELLARVFKFL
tara:strand:+ start:633 stop:785 length:153 start_codon:yes stop_codon:yes gene_type:complete